MIDNRAHKLTLETAILVFLITLGTSQAATITVCDCRACGCQYLDIQEAIGRAQPGDTVRVRSGSFHTNVEVNKPIILRGERWKGRDLPFIDAGGLGSAITVSADGATVEGMRAANSGNQSKDAGIRVLSNNNTIKDNKAWECRAGILFEGSGNNVVISNEAVENLYGIRLQGSADNVLSGNRLFDNVEADAFDDGLNRWDDGSLGNSYGGFNCTDEDKNGVCDSAYNITGGPSVDRYPLAQ